MSTDRIGNDADTPGPALLARRFESAWRADSRRLDPADFLPGGPEADPAALLAVLRADLALRREACEPARVEPHGAIARDAWGVARRTSATRVGTGPASARDAWRGRHAKVG
jgi:hypothetical protein